MSGKAWQRVGSAVVCAVVLLEGATVARANNMGCCVLQNGDCTTATAAVCTSLNGTLQGVGTRICNNNVCAPGIGCASCINGSNNGTPCDDSGDCTGGGTCSVAADPIPAASTWGLLALMLTITICGTLTLQRRRCTA